MSGDMNLAFKLGDNSKNSDAASNAPSMTDFLIPWFIT
jgi:hypothetical protein